MHFVAEARHPWKTTRTGDISLSDNGRWTKGTVGANASHFDGAALCVSR
jgi:hypothetical protein